MSVPVFPQLAVPAGRHLFGFVLSIKEGKLIPIKEYGAPDFLRYRCVACFQLNGIDWSREEVDGGLKRRGDNRAWHSACSHLRIALGGHILRRQLVAGELAAVKRLSRKYPDAALSAGTIAEYRRRVWTPLLFGWVTGQTLVELRRTVRVTKFKVDSPELRTAFAKIEVAVETGRRLDAWRVASKLAFDQAIEVVPAASARPHVDRDQFGKRAIRVKESA